jgi:hypothetical protein
MGPQIKAGHMGAPLPYGVRLKRALDRGVVPHMRMSQFSKSAEVVLAP